MGFGATTIIRWMDGYDIGRRGVSETKLPLNFKKPSKEWFVREYVEKERSSIDIAKELGVSPQSVIKWLKKDDIEMRQKKNIYDNKKLRRKLVDRLLEITGKNPEELTTKNFGIKGITERSGSCRGILGWYMRKHDCKNAEARDILIQDLYGVSRKNVSDDERLENVIDGFLEG